MYNLPFIINIVEFRVIKKKKGKSDDEIFLKIFSTAILIFFFRIRY